MASEHDRVYWQWLAVRLRQGDETAAEKLVAAFGQPLLFYLRRLLQSENDAWDCAQETWISALGGIRHLRKPEAVAAFIYKVARNHALAHLRRRKPALTFQDDESPAMETLDDASFTLEDAEAIREALDRLPEVQRDVLTLFFLDDLSVREIAEVLGIPAGTVKSRLFHAKLALRRILTQMGYSHEC